MLRSPHLLRDELETLLNVLLEVGQAVFEQRLLLLRELTEAVDLLHTVGLERDKKIRVTTIRDDYG